jgi:drug/metabolite transporter (DMT)-like permease
MAARTSDYLKLHFLIFLWGFTAILGLLVKIPAIEMVIFRTLVATIGMGVLIFFRNQSFKLPARSMLLVFFTGFVVAAHWIAFFGSARVSNASVSLVGFATASLWAAIIEPIMNKSKIKGYEIALGLVVISGLYIIFSFDFRYPLGLLLGIVSGFFSSLFFTFNQRFGKQIGTFQITFYEMFGACVGTSVYLVFHVFVVDPDYKINFNADLTDWLCILTLGLVCTVYAFSVSVDLMKRLSVFFMQLNINLEPVYGIILAVLIFGKTETMNLQFYIGTLVILVAVAMYPVLRKKFNPDPFREETMH